MSGRPHLAVILPLAVALAASAAPVAADSPIYLPIIMAPLPTWQQVGDGSAFGGGVSNNATASSHPSLAIAPDGTPYVAWCDRASDYDIYVRRWNGQSWEEVGAGSATGGGVSDSSGASFRPSLAVAPDGVPCVAWDELGFGRWEIFIRCWDGATWQELGTGSATGGGISDNAGESNVPSLAFSPQGTPYVAWTDDSSGDDEIYIKRWNGTSWEEVGPGSASGGGVSDDDSESGYPSLAFAPDGTPVVAWADIRDRSRQVYIRRWDGLSWSEVGSGSASGGGISNSADGATYPSLGIAHDGTPYVAWQEHWWGSQIYARHWNGSSWEEVGSGSAGGGGISNTSGRSRDPSLAVASDDTVYVAWSDESTMYEQIYVLHWDGSAWEQVGPGSACGGGISGTSGYSRNASLAISPLGAGGGSPYVAWEQFSDPDYEVFVKTYPQTSTGGGN